MQTFIETYLACLLAYFTAWPLVQCAFWPWLYRRFLAANEDAVRKRMGEELLEILRRADLNRQLVPVTPCRPVDETDYDLDDYDYNEED